MRNETEKETPKKKKKLGCCGCLAIFCLVFVLIIGAGVGVGWFFGDKYMKQYFDMSLTDAFGVIGGLYKSDEKKIVTNAPDAADEQNFYDAVGESLYLKDGTLNSESFSAISETITGGSSSSGDSTGTTTTPTENQVNAVRKAAESGDTQSALENLICRENMDVDKVRAKFTADYDYTSNYTADFTVEVTDKELFAALKIVLESKLSDQDNAVLEHLTFEQLTLSKGAGGNAVVTIVAKFNVKEFIGKQLGDAPGIAKWAATTFLPKKIYVTASVETGEKLTADILVNQMDEKGKENVYKLVSGILKLQGAENTDAKKYLSDTVDSAMGSAVKAINDALDLNGNVSDGKMRFDIYAALATTAFSGKDVSKVELAEAYTSVVAADIDNMLKNNEKLLFENKWELDNAGQIIEVYSTDDEEMISKGATGINYGDRFTAEFEKKYLMRTEFYRVGAKTFFDPVWTDADGNTYKQSELKLNGAAPTEKNKRLYRQIAEPHAIKENVSGSEAADYDVLLIAEFVKLDYNDLAALMGVGTSEKTTGIKLEGLFDSRKLTEKLGGGAAGTRDEQFLYRSDDELRLELTDKMLGRLMAEQTKTVFSGDNALTSSLELKFVGLTRGNEETLTLTDEAGNVIGAKPIERRFMTVGFIAGVEQIAGSTGVIKSLIGDRIGVISKLDVTPGLEDKYLNAPEVEYADLGKSRTDDLLATLEKIGASAFKPEEIDRQLAQPVRDLIAKMSKTLGEVTVENDELSVPNVFAVLAAQLFPLESEKTFGGEPIALSGSDVHVALQGVYDLPPMTVADNKRYIQRVAGTHYDYEVQTNKVDNINNLGVSKPDNDLGRVLGYYEDETSNIMYFSYDYSLAKYLDGSSSDMSLLAVDEVVVTFEIDKSQAEKVNGVDCYKTKMWVNDMSEADRTLLEKMITYFDRSNENKFPELEAKMGAFAYRIINTPELKSVVDNGILGA